MLNSIKMSQGCKICGFAEHPAALDFDHRDPATKKFNISSRFLHAPEKRLREEIAKCDVLCANCHRIRSATLGHSHNRTNWPRKNQGGDEDLKKAAWYLNRLTQS